MTALWVWTMIKADQTRNLGLLVVPIVIWLVPGVARAASNRWRIADWVVFTVLYGVFAAFMPLVLLFANNLCFGGDCPRDVHGINGLLVTCFLFNPLLIGIGSLLAIPSRIERARLKAEVASRHGSPAH
jgi:hypothetical protein